MGALRAYLPFAMRVAFGLAILGIAFSLIDVPAMLDALANMHPMTLVMVFLISVTASIVVPAVITRYLFTARGESPRISGLIAINLALRFYVLVAPQVITVAIRWRRYRRLMGGWGWDAAALIAFERTAQLCAVLVIALLCLAATAASLPTQLYPLVPIVGLLALLVASLFLLFVSERSFAVFEPRVSALAARLPGVIGRRVSSLLDATREYQSLQRHGVSRVLAWSFVAQILSIMAAFVVASALGIPVELFEIGWMRSLVYLLTLIPVSVAGIGIREGGFAALLYFYGVDGHLALALPVTLLAVQLAIGLIGAMSEAFSAFSRGAR
jgi:glycosyltransferase 2 family protein